MSKKNKSEEPELTQGEDVAMLPVKRNPFKKENYNFQYFFDEPELKEKSKHLAKSCEERNSLEDQKKSVMSEFKSKLDSKNAEINLISGNINNGYEWLTKTCDVEYDFYNGEKNYYLNGKLVGTEKIFG